MKTKTAYLAVLHVVNVIFLAVVGLIAVTMFSNTSPGAISSFNPVDLGFVIFLLLALVGSYMFEMKMGRWGALLIGSLLYISVFLASLVVFPLMHIYFLS